MGKYVDKLKERWGVETGWQVLLILFIFSITGMTALYVRKFFFTLFGFDAQTPIWAKILVWILTVVPSYQILFLTYGFLLGQFDFVWRFEKKSARRIKKLFSSE
jgi:hypothetical protein